MSNVEAIKKADNAPDRIWATVNGMSTRYPDGSRRLIGGWQQDAGRAESVEYVRATALEALQRENEEKTRDLNACQEQAVKDGNEISYLKSWQDGAISCREAEQARIDEYKARAKAAEAEEKRLREALTGLVEDLEARSVNGTVNCSHGVYCTAKEALASRGGEHNAE